METKTNQPSAILALGIVAALLSACASDTDLETAFCTSLGEAPAGAVTASVDPSSAPSVALEDQNAEVTLVDIGGGNLGGSVEYTADEAGHFAFGLSADIPFAVTDSSGAVVPIVTSVQGSSMCSELAVRHTFLLDLKPYRLTFGATDATAVRIVAEESNDDLAQ